jgi:hypothetical protein
MLGRGYCCSESLKAAAFAAFCFRQFSTSFTLAASSWLGPGGESLLMQRDDYDVIAYHAYDPQTGHPALQISTLTWQNDWPHAAVEQ